jgi:hypothetical protein
LDQTPRPRVTVSLAYFPEENIMSKPEIVTSSNISHNKPSDGINEQTKQEIRERAYQLFEKRGAEHGHDVEDWMRAEEEVLQHSKVQRAA